MVLSDGKIRSIDGVVRVFNDFALWSGLRISMEKSTLFLAGTSATAHQTITSTYPFSVGTLPVRYLGLPLVNKRLSAADYLPLLEKIRQRIGSWTARFLSFAGRLNLISSVLWSICNFWMAAFRLPRGCIREVDKICSAFLWSGQEMKTTKAKVSWQEICKPKHEGGSWMWKKLLKYRAVASPLCRAEVKNGQTTSFWYDNWSDLGRLSDLVGERGAIDLGIDWQKSVADAWTMRRRRRHRDGLLMQIEEALNKKMQNRKDEADHILWRGINDTYRPRFSTKDTWHHLRTISPTITWHKGVWFTHATPRQSFCVWLAVLNRLSTGDRMRMWNVGATDTCFLCHTETVIYALWRERNGRMHGDDPNPPARLVGWLDKQIRNRLSAIRLMGDGRYASGLQKWFASKH
ncbi:Contains similarity to reverse transcriptase-like protein gb/2244803 from A. thaliana chromosome 4 contig gb/Z97336 [Arabidopsis thaliana]|uniref:T13D8.19 protein n=1 Tax=Arabidopsis thaliana TaxID=3702 RepID=O80753_ARATH|nr:Contains similarity to reverse transcriptase-like protein gb/2244803 from A. thaliana chromosome 4 contig gb/Z97336 [Arabidopsis thaliana]